MTNWQWHGDHTVPNIVVIGFVNTPVVRSALKAPPDFVLLTVVVAVARTLGVIRERETSFSVPRKSPLDSCKGCIYFCLLLTSNVVSLPVLSDTEEASAARM